MRVCSAQLISRFNDIRPSQQHSGIKPSGELTHDSHRFIDRGWQQLRAYGPSNEELQQVYDLGERDSVIGQMGMSAFDGLLGLPKIGSRSKPSTEQTVCRA